MTAFQAPSSNDLTIILPKSEQSSFRGLFARSSSGSCSTPRLQSPSSKPSLRVEKRQCFVTKLFKVQRYVVRAIAVVSLLLATTLIAAAWNARRIAWASTQFCSAQTTHGTTVNFVATPEEASRQARKNNKLTFLLHISGNFEDSDFT